MSINSLLSPMTWFHFNLNYLTLTFMYSLLFPISLIVSFVLECALYYIVNMYVILYYILFSFLYISSRVKDNDPSYVCKMYSYSSPLCNSYNSFASFQIISAATWFQLFLAAAPGIILYEFLYYWKTLWSVFLPYETFFSHMKRFSFAKH